MSVFSALFGGKESENNSGKIVLEGNTNDLLAVSNDGEIKQTRFFYRLGDNMEEEVFDISITSSNPYKSFPIFDSFLDKKIRITVEVVD